MIELQLLAAIERDSGVTQRNLARELGIALGLTNAYLRRCVKKGLVKIHQAPINRYAYYLTPHGFAEKSRLTADYLFRSLDFFRRARADCAALLKQCEGAGWRRIALWGAGDLAEIAILSAADMSIEIICVIDPERAERRCAGLPIEPSLAAAQLRAGAFGLDGIVVTDTQAPQACFEMLVSAAAECGFATEDIVIPRLLQSVPVSSIATADRGQ